MILLITNWGWEKKLSITHHCFIISYGTLIGGSRRTGTNSSLLWRARHIAGGEEIKQRRKASACMRTHPHGRCVMAFFSEDLFQVFEEKLDPVSLTGKKRRRKNKEEENKKQDDPKKRVKLDEETGPSTNTGDEASSLDAPAGDEGEIKDEAM